MPQDATQADPAGDSHVARRQHSTLSSVRNAARLLKEFSHGSREIGVTELSKRLGIGKSTAHRLLNTLAEERLLEQDPVTGAYRLGIAMYELGTSVSMHTDLHEASAAVIDQLRNATREAVQVAVLDELDVVYLESREGTQSTRLSGRVGYRNSAHCTASGKVLLAHLSPQRLDALLADWKPKRKTPNTIHDVTTLRAQLDAIRARGWAQALDEAEVGVSSLAAPIRNAMGDTIAAISVTAPSTRLNDEALRRMARPVVEAGAAISTRLGYRDNATGRERA